MSEFNLTKPADLAALTGANIFNLKKGTNKKGYQPDEKDPEEEKQNALAAVRENPRSALMLLDAGRSDGTLTLQGQSRLLETILGEISDPEEARQLLEETIPLEQAAEMIAVRGDLPAIASEIASIDVIMASITIDAAEMPSLTSLMVQAWAAKLCERDDWEDILNYPLDEKGHTFRDHLVAAVVYQWSANPTPDIWEDVGLDPDTEHEVIFELRMDADSVAIARQKLQERAKEMTTAPTLSTDAAELADEIDI